MGFLLSMGVRHRSALPFPAEYTRASPLPEGCCTGFFASEAGNFLAACLKRAEGYTAVLRILQDVFIKQDLCINLGI